MKPILPPAELFPIAAARGALLSCCWPGKLADFVILDRNLLTIAPMQLREAQVLETHIGGARVFSG